MMKKGLQISILTALMCSAAMGAKSTRVCLFDGNTPLEFADPNVPSYRDIMVGTHLTIIIDSNTAGYWDYGELSIWGTDRNYGVLSGRDYNETTYNWDGSRLPAAGEEAKAEDFQESPASGFRFMASDDAAAGDWFIIDYNATHVGTCRVAFFDGDVEWDNPLYRMAFTHVPTRDINQDHIVNFADFAVVGLYWHITNCTDPNGCGKVDFDGNKIIDINDLGLFSEYWLERTD